MYQIFFAIGHALEYTFKVLVALGWLPVILISIILSIGMVYWLIVQSRYNREARSRGTLI